MADLTTLSYLQTALAGGGMNLSPAQVSAAPQLLAAASRMVRKHCNRYFSRMVFDGLYTVDSPSRFVLTREYPVNSVIRASTAPTVVIAISNSDTATNQRAYYSLVKHDGGSPPTEIATGPADVLDLPPVFNGLKLVRIASGTPHVDILKFSVCTTVQLLANAVNAAGGGWAATVATGYGAWPTQDPEHTDLCYFRPLQGAVPALGNMSSGLVMHVDDIFVQVRGDTGDINLASAEMDDPFQSMKFGGYLSTDIGDVSDFGGYQGLRLIYDAGMDTVYEDVQQAVVETVAHWMTLAGLDQTVESETIGSYEYKLAPDTIARYGLPASAVAKLSYYRSNRC